jgi:hypothetical protein
LSLSSQSLPLRGQSRDANRPWLVNSSAGGLSAFQVPGADFCSGGWAQRTVKSSKDMMAYGSLLAADTLRA